LSLDAVAAFTDPVFDGLDPRVKRNAVVRRERPEFGGLPLARLPFSEVELEPVERLLPPARREVIRGFGATKAALFQERTSRFPIVLLSTHGIADDRQPELSSIVLTMIDREGHSMDGLVHLYELYALRLRSLVILSACETASGKQVRGEGLIGMARGFLETGASGLLAAPGRVDAEASAWLVRAFLEQMLQPATTTPPRALLNARRILASSKRWGDPYYWGSFVLFSSFSPGEKFPSTAK
jgi:CHAT domain-containing protein